MPLETGETSMRFRADLLGWTGLPAGPLLNHAVNPKLDQLVGG